MGVASTAPVSCPPAASPSSRQATPPFSTCDHCDDEFEPSKYNPNQRFCSDNCRKDRWHEKQVEEGNCRECGQEDPAGYYCVDCREGHNRRDRELRQRWKEEGKCTRCGRIHPYDGTCSYAHDLM